MVQGASIHETVSIVGDVSIGEGTYVGPGVTLFGPCRIGRDNVIGPNVVIGAPPQDDAWSTDAHSQAYMGGDRGHATLIGDGNVIREFVTIHRGTERPTSVGDRNYLMAYSHIAHDCRLGDRCKITNSVQFGGHSVVLDGAYVGLAAVVHQFTIIGSASIVGMGSAVSHDVLPGAKVVGMPARCVGPNKIALSSLEGVGEFSWWASYVRGEVIEAPAAVRQMRSEWEEARRERDRWRDLIREVRKSQLSEIRATHDGPVSDA